MTILIDTVTLGEVEGSRFRTLDIDTGDWSVVATIDDDTEIVVSEHANEEEAEEAIEEVADLLASEGDVFPSLILQDLAVLGTFRSALAGQRVEIATRELNLIELITDHPDESLPGGLFSEDSAGALRTVLRSPTGTGGTAEIELWSPHGGVSGARISASFATIATETLTLEVDSMVLEGSLEFGADLPWDLPWGPIKRLTASSNTTGITSGSTIFSHTMPSWPAGRLIKVTYTGSLSATAAGAATAYLNTGGSPGARWGSVGVSALVSAPFTLVQVRRSDDVSGQTIAGTVVQDSGSGTTTYQAGTGRTGYFLIEDVGPNPDA